VGQLYSKRDLKKSVMRVWDGFNWLRIGSSVGLWGTIKDWKFLDWLSYCCFVKKEYSTYMLYNMDTIYILYKI
jgi:hypothetical protein